MSGKLLNGRPVYCGRAQKKKEWMVELQRRYEAERMERYSRWECVGMVSHCHVIWFSHDPQFPLSMVNHCAYHSNMFTLPVVLMVEVDLLGSVLQYVYSM